MAHYRNHFLRSLFKALFFILQNTDALINNSPAFYALHCASLHPAHGAGNSFVHILLCNCQSHITAHHLLDCFSITYYTVFVHNWKNFKRV